MHHDELLLATTILLTASIASVVIFQRAGMGSVLGLLAAGVAVGPSGLAITDEVDLLREIAEIGIAFLLFIIGLEMDPRRLWAMRKTVFGVGVAQVLITALVLAGGALLFGNALKPSIVMGLGLALSSTAFVIQLLEERGELVSRHGETAFGILLLQDLAVVPLLMLVGVMADMPAEGHEAADPLLMVGMVALVALVGRWILPRALAYVASRHQPGLFSGHATLAVILSAWAMEVAGLSMALGAFLMGMLLSRTPYRHQIEADVVPFKGLLLSLFFISVGMSIDLAVLTDHLVIILLVVVCIIATKIVLLYVIARAFRTPSADAIRVAFLLSQGGEFGFVIFGAAELTGLLSSELFVQTVLVISISMAATPLLIRLGNRFADRFADDSQGAPTAPPAVENHAIVCGFGRNGRAIAAMLQASGIPFVAIERDPNRAPGSIEGGKVIFGNAADRQLLATAQTGRAAAVVVTLDKPKAVRQVITTLRNYYPDIPVLARARDLAERDTLRLEGVTEAVADAVEEALALGAATLRRVGVEDDRAAMIIEQLRQDDYAELRAMEATTHPHGRKERG